ncbi:MAG TPA: LysM peptidoglycan-binding domain-containing protein [Anaerolineales bacterium]
MKKLHRAFLVFFLLFALILSFTTAHARTDNLPPRQEPFSTPTLPSPPFPADVINAVNTLRLANGLNALAVHPVLMQVAALQANALAASEGAVGHQRPCGMTLGQQLLSLGYPLWGDLSLDGYRSENWVAAMTIEQVMQFWQGDAEHLNTMLSPDRSDIGAAVTVSDQIYVVLETALKTPSNQHQSTAYDILTGIPMTQTLCAGFSSGDISNYSVPVVISTARPDGDVIHEVQYGQTLWTLADRYHVSIEEIKRLNGLVDDTVVPGWKLLIQKSATQPPPVTDTPLVIVTSTETKFPTAIPFHTKTPILTPTRPLASLSEQIKGNSTVVAALLIAFSVLLAGIIGFGRKKE